MPKEKLVAVFVPGLMGSCLRVKASKSVVWGEDLLDNYRRLANEADLFDFSSELEACSILKKIRFFGIPCRNIYGTILAALRKNSSYASVCDGYYDWRKSNIDSAKEFFERLSVELAVDLKVPQAGLRLRFVTHSMGALVVRAGLIHEYLHCENVLDIYHVAPPLLGAPFSFRALFTEDSLPLLSPYVRWMTLYPDSNIAVRRLLAALSKFPSLYELMPRKDRSFIQVTDDAGREPINCVNPVYERITPSPLRSSCVSKARTAHAMLDSFCSRFDGKFPVHVIYGENNESLRTDLQYYVLKQGLSWKLEFPIPFYSNTNGDGSVPDWSCANESGAACLHPIPNCQHDTMCADWKVMDKLEILGVI